MKLPSRKQYLNDVESIANRIYSNYKPTSLEDLIENILPKEFPYIYEMMYSESWKYTEKEREKLEKFLGIQHIYTPFEKIFIRGTFDFIKFLSEHSYFESYLFMYNWEIFIYLFKNGLLNYFKNKWLFYAADSAVEEVICILISRICKIDIKIIKIYDFKDRKKHDEDNIKETIKKCMEEFDMKHFDLCLSNPPYDGILNLKILYNLFDIANNIIFVHPSTFLLDSKNTEPIYKKIKDSGFLQKATLFWANKLFGIKLFCPCVISVWNTKNKENEVEIIDNAFKNWFYFGKSCSYKCKTSEMSLHGSKNNLLIDLKLELNNFIDQKNTLFYKRNISNNLTKYNVLFPRIRGGSDILKNDGENTCEHFFSFFGYQNDDYKKDETFSFKTNIPDNEKLIWSFQTENEMNNFICYCKSKVARFFLSFIKKNGNLHRGELKYIPWLDFTQEWNDAKLCKEFGISKELWQYIDNFIPDYYDDYKSGFEKDEEK